MLRIPESGLWNTKMNGGLLVYHILNCLCNNFVMISNNDFDLITSADCCLDCNGFIISSGDQQPIR